MTRYSKLVLFSFIVASTLPEQAFSMFGKGSKKEDKKEKKDEDYEYDYDYDYEDDEKDEDGKYYFDDDEMYSDRFVVNSFTARVINNANGEEALLQLLDDKQMLGSIKARIPEAGDASAMADISEYTQDGEDGDVDFAFGDMKPIATIGEVDKKTGMMLVGVPDGLGATLVDDGAVRVMVQSESYLPGVTSRPGEVGESYPYYVNVNQNPASYTGSHVQYIDYKRNMLKKYMEKDFPAADMILRSGEMIKHAFNLKDERVGPRNREGPTVTGAHYSNTDAEGNYVVKSAPVKADWLMQSMCGASFSEPHMWGEGIGAEDKLFISNEEWIDLVEGVTGFVGLPVHVVDVDNYVDYAIGAMTNGGFEKIVEINCGHPDYVCYSTAGYNGAFGDNAAAGLLEMKKNVTGALRADGKEWVWTRDVVPARVYIGKKGAMEDGSPAPADDFKARNGLRYGKVYGFATDMSADGATGGNFRDAFHKNATLATNGAKVPGYFWPIKWQWNGTVTDFIHDGAWDFQEPIPGAPENVQYWNANGMDAKGCKMEHNSADKRSGKSAFVQGSTCGYFGHYYLDNLAEMLANANGDLPGAIDASYYVYQGETSIKDQIDMGGKGAYAGGLDATINYSGGEASGEGIKAVETFEDIDGFELVITQDEKLHAIIQEDSGNRYGERMFITSELKHDGNPLTYYLLGISGGDMNTRMAAAVGVPAGTNQPLQYGKSGHEFSGVFDLSGLLHEDFEFGDPGYKKIEAEKKVAMNDKDIILILQAHNFFAGQFDFFNADRGGQWLLYRPDVEAFE